jgi:TrmH family RNA methyltransferase
MQKTERARAQERLRPISSAQNTLVKELRRAFARGECTSDGYCAIEGVRSIEEAVRSGLRFHAIFFSASGADRAARLLPQIASHAEALLLPDAVFQSAVATETPQGVAALVQPKKFALDEVLAAPAPLLLVIAGVQDPGNLGTIIRSAEAFGSTGVLLTEGTVSLWNPKVVRAAAGSAFRLPVLKVASAQAAEKLRACRVRLLASSSHKGTPLDEAELTGAVALLIGNEGAGLPRALLAAADETIAIPHSERVESLNAGVAASVLLYEAARQRRSL